MKHYISEVITVYDGDLIGWTTAELIEKVGELGEYERWVMKTREGSQLVRLVDFDKNYRKNKPNQNG
ncbi:hypothetical protein Ccar_16410 [Clostridium carboxidivorans P7]|uniref:hypothetical protein n=1 Tax=Clostridium carboxidivorans TaxID=217159 RepID=UPI00064E52E7|nr:hypothetical protein [Clostridium carboxidivorans]AKN32359.1 hypothetical protein Ccar_16410 [Clostridium carboxidivorans P7]